MREQILLVILKGEARVKVREYEMFDVRSRREVSSLQGPERSSERWRNTNKSYSNRNSRSRVIQKSKLSILWTDSSWTEWQTDGSKQRRVVSRGCERLPCVCRPTGSGWGLSYFGIQTVLCNTASATTTSCAVPLINNALHECTCRPTVVP